MRVPTESLRHSIKELYQVFSRYPLRKNVGGCSCCVAEQDHHNLHAAPLQQLTAEHLNNFAFKAMTTWGDADDFRHFLPRLFELLVIEPEFAVAAETLIGKLDYGNWREWPAREQEVLEQFLRALWSEVIVTKPDHLDANSCLCSIAIVMDDTRPFLEAWLRDSSIAALRNLCEFVGDIAPQLIKKHSLGGWWADRPDQVKQLSMWMSSQATEQYFMDAYLNYADTEFADEIAQASDLIAVLKSVQR